VIATGLSIGAVDLDHFDALAAQEAGQTHPIRAGALHADLGHLAEGLEPAEKRLIASGISAEGLGSDQPPEGIERGGNVLVEVGVDAPGYPGRGFYDGHGYPFLLNG
jgi:hypothetical protein